MIYNSAGKMISRIWGDPHVEDDSGVAGDDWHFGNDSTFILADGTEIMFNTEGNANNNVYVTTGLYIKSGDSVYQTGQSFGTSMTGVASSSGARNAGISKLAISATEFDAQYADAADKKNGAGVFAYSAQANSGRGGWAVMTDGGVFQDIKYEGWGTYLQAGKASFDGQYDGQVSVSKAQMIAALDGDAVRSFKSLSNSPAGSQIVPGSNPPIKADDLFLNYYFKEGADTKELKAFSDMISNGSSAEKLSVLDDYIRNGAEIPLTEAQESKFLNYLITPATSGIAKTYLELIENQADPQKFELLDKLARGEYTLNTSQQDVFFDFLLDFQNAKLAETYAGIIQKGADQASIQYLEDYAAGKLVITLNTDQENKMLDYLGGSKNANIAKTYVNFIKEGASVGKLATLNDIFEGSGSTIRVLKQEDLRFKESLVTLKNSYGVGSTAYYSQIVDNFSNANPDSVNEILAATIKLNQDTSVTKSRLVASSESAIEDMISVMKDPLKQIASNKNELFSAYPDGLELAAKVLSMQLNLLGSMDQNTEAVIAAQDQANTLLSYIPDYLKNPDASLSGLNIKDRKDYYVFLSAFPVGSKPTEQQKKDALALIQGNMILADNQEFLQSYGKLVATGDNASASKLAQIANFIGADNNYTYQARGFSNTNLSARNIEVAYNILEFSQNLKEQNYSNYAANNFMLETVLNNAKGFNTSIESDLTIAFFDSLEDTLEGKPETLSAAAYDKFITGVIAGFGNDLYYNGAVGIKSSSEQVKNNSTYRNQLGLNNVSVANLQIEQFESMIEFFNLQIAQESAKEQPNTGKIDNYRSQINSHQAAINSLRNL
jgi:hypothetical protein